MAAKVLERDTTLLEVQSELARSSAKSSDWQTLLDHSLAIVSQHLHFERAIVALLESDGQTYRLQTIVDQSHPASSIAESPSPRVEEMLAALRQDHHWHLLKESDLPHVNGSARYEDAAENHLLMPLEAYGIWLGALLLSTSRAQGFD